MLSTLGVDAVSIARELKANRGELDGQPIPELGFSFSVWNGQEEPLSASFSVSIGMWSGTETNAVILSFEHKLADSTEHAILAQMIAAFDPDNGVVSFYERLPRSAGTSVWEFGRLTFRRGGAIEQHIMPARTADY